MTSPTYRPAPTPARMFIHDDFCRHSGFWGAGCTCWASQAETRQIVEDVSRAFAADLKEIVRGNR